MATAGTGNLKSIIGFGCSSLISVGRKKGLHLLETAFDAGIRHFDVARYYGYGETEAILGSFLQSRRSQLTITTKFGIEPPRRTSALRMVLGVGRPFLKLVPAARKVVQQHASAVLVRGNAFSVADARRNLDTSLRELRTDFIDFYLLHDYVPGEHSSEELVLFLREAVQAGKIREFGIGTSFDNVLRARESEPDLCGVVQFQDCILTRNRNKLPFGAQHRLVVTYGALSGAYARLSEFLSADKKTANDWSAALDLDCSNPGTLAALLLNCGVKSNRGGLLLFSARSADRIRNNAKSVLERTVTLSQLELFERLAESHSAALKEGHGL